MYDRRIEANEFVGASRAEAVAKACKFYGAEESDLRVNELPADLSGAAGRVVVVAQRADAPRPAPGGDRGERGRDRDRGDRGDRGGRGRDRGERGDRDRGRGRDRDRGRGRERGDRDRDRDREGGRMREGASRVDAEPAPVEDDDENREPSVGKAVGELETVGRFILGAIERLDLGPFEIRETEEDQFVVYQLSGAAADRLATGDGRAGDALQLIANQAAMQISEDHKRVVVDIEGDRERREEFLGRVAQRAAKRASDTGRAVALDPMNGKDRRAIHLALRDEDGVATMSIGEGPYRQVVVVPEGAPEYEEALKAMEAASSAS